MVSKDTIATPYIIFLTHSFCIEEWIHPEKEMSAKLLQYVASSTTGRRTEHYWSTRKAIVLTTM